VRVRWGEEREIRLIVLDRVFARLHYKTTRCARRSVAAFVYRSSKYRAHQYSVCPRRVNIKCGNIIDRVSQQQQQWSLRISLSRVIRARINIYSNIYIYICTFRSMDKPTLTYVITIQSSRDNSKLKGDKNSLRVM
jgi:hypothetical protein